MKVRRSLKIFIVCTIMGMATITVVGFSTLTANYFEKGLDSGLRINMQEIGRFTSVESEKNILGFQVVRQ